MKKGIAILLVLVMSMSAIAAAFGSTDPVGTDMQGEQVGLPYQPGIASSVNDLDDPMLDYIRSLDMSRPDPVNPCLEMRRIRSFRKGTPMRSSCTRIP